MFYSNYRLKDSRQIRRILILGHSGFIGSRIFNLFRSQAPELEIIGKSLPEFDLTKLEHILSDERLFDMRTLVIMCACIKKQFSDSLEIFFQNLKMVLNLCHLLQRNPVRRLIYFSSAEVYGEDTENLNITEQTAVNPTTYYGMAKYTSECLLRKIIESREDSSLLILRPPVVYGPNDISHTYGPTGFIWSAINTGKIILWGDGSELREFMFIEDLVEIIYRLAFSKSKGVLNVASGQSYAFIDILEIVADLFSRKLEITSRPRTKRKVDNKFCNDTLVKLLPDFSFTDLRDGIKRTFEAEYGYMSSLQKQKA